MFKRLKTYQLRGDKIILVSDLPKVFETDKYVFNIMLSEAIKEKAIPEGEVVELSKDDEIELFGKPKNKYKKVWALTLLGALLFSKYLNWKKNKTIEDYRDWLYDKERNIQILEKEMKYYRNNKHISMLQDSYNTVRYLNNMFRNELYRLTKDEFYAPKPDDPRSYTEMIKDDYFNYCSQNPEFYYPFMN